jgi:hypothetical protein
MLIINNNRGSAPHEAAEFFTFSETESYIFIYGAELNHYTFTFTMQ